MWSRVVEFMLGCWLAISPFIFEPAADDTMRWFADWTCASLVITFAMLSYWRPLRHIHVATALVALAMIAYGRFASPGHITPGLQNHILVGLLLLMFSIIPNHASQPPRWWHTGASPLP